MLQQFYPRGTSLISVGICAGGPWRLSKRGGGKRLLPLSRDSVILSPHILVTKLIKLSLILKLFLLSSSSSSPKSKPLLLVVLVTLNAIIFFNKIINFTVRNASYIFSRVLSKTGVCCTVRTHHGLSVNRVQFQYMSEFSVMGRITALKD